MVSVLDSRYLAVTAIVTVVYQFSFFLVTYFCKFDKLTDFAGGTNFLVLAVLTYFLSAQYTARQTVLTVLVFVWALRLALFLLYRIILWGEDRRFDDKRENLGRLAVFWTLQAIWVWTVSLPVTILNSTSKARNPPIGATDIIGWIIFVIGLVLESVADMQKLYFKQSPESRGRWIDVGLWKYSRHPNYFGEILVWIGAFLASCRVFVGGEWAAILGPIFIFLILMFLSGAPLTEKSADNRHGAKEEYRAYKRRTSILVPLPNSFYERLPESVKSTVLLDLPMYNTYRKTNGEATESTPISPAPNTDSA